MDTYYCVRLTNMERTSGWYDTCEIQLHKQYSTVALSNDK